MNERKALPPGAYTTVRAWGQDQWAAVVAAQGRVITLAIYADRSSAFGAAIGKAKSEGIDCLVQRVAA